MNAAYIAGIFDGEGSIGIYRYFGNKYVLRTQFTQNKNHISTKLVTGLRKRFGGGLGLHRTSSGRLAFNWQLGSRAAAKFLKFMYPHLLLKKSQAKIAITWMESKPLPSRNRTTGHFNPYPGRKTDRRIVQKLKRLKTKLRGEK